jgi:hypothetical protein
VYVVTDRGDCIEVNEVVPFVFTATRFGGQRVP